MDRKSITILALCFGLLLLWSSVIVPKLYPPKPLPPGATNALTAVPSLESTNAAAITSAPLSLAPAAALPSAPKLNVAPEVREEFLVISNENARYTFTSLGGGLKWVELVKYPETVGSRRHNEEPTHRVATLNSQATLPTLAVLGDAAVQGDGVFQLTPTDTGIRAEKSLPNGLTLIKNFVLGTNYLLSATVRLENRSTNALSLPPQEWVVGTATPMNALDDGMTSVGMMWFNGQKSQEIIGESHFSSSGFACMPRTPPVDYRAGATNVVWASAHNQFFALVAMPKQAAEQVILRKVPLPPPSTEEIQANPRIVRAPKGYVATLVYPAVTLAPRETLDREFTLYTGPKEYRTLAQIAGRFNNGLDEIMGFGWFGFFSKALLLGMNWLHSVAHISYGWAIIVITVIIKVLFWPLTAASTRSMKRLQTLQPQMKAIQEKYKDDPVKMNRKVMEFMKENKVNPMGGCLPMVLQMPVFIGFFYMIRSAIELRGASFMWVTDLSRPDTLFFIPGVGFPFNLLPLLMGATMLWQAHLTPPSPGMDPMQQKLMRYMPLIFLVFLYNFSAGLTLYWTVQNLLTIAQTKLTRMSAAATPPATAPVLTPKPKKKK